MAIKPETQFIKSIHTYLAKFSEPVYSMKNHNEYVGGVPDVWYSGSAHDLWIEYKYKPVNEFKKNLIPDLSALQLKWIRSRQEEGRTVWTIVGCKKGGVIFDTWETMERGLRPTDLEYALLSRQAIAREIICFVNWPYTPQEQL